MQSKLIQGWYMEQASSVEEAEKQRCYNALYSKSRIHGVDSCEVCKSFVADSSNI
ncbi:hypothetical protein ACE6H2_012057 [Prunus campanulata]